MSGPKIDLIELERQRKAELERQRQERLRKIREETEKLNTEIYKTKAQIEYINKHLVSITHNIGDADEMALTIQKLHTLKNSFKNQLVKALEIDVPTEPGDIATCFQKLARETDIIVANYHVEVKSLEDLMVEFNNHLEIQKKFVSISQELSTEIEKMGNIEDLDLSVLLENLACSNLEFSVEERATQILSEIDGFVNSESIQESDMKVLLAIANNIFKTAFETKNSFEAAAIEYNTIKSTVIKNMAIFDDIYQDYYAGYVDYLKSINSHIATPVKIIPKRKYRFGSIDELQNEITLLVQKSKIALERNYIREQIDEVMQLFEYNMLTEIILNSNQSGNHYVCENKTGNAAIHIHLSDKKQIMMEIVGIGKSARHTNAESITSVMKPTSDLESSERDALLGEQGSFCMLHPKITEELGKRGLIMQMKARKTPDVKYCNKIVHFTGSDTTVMDELINDEYEYNEHATKRGRKKKEKQLRALKI